MTDSDISFIADLESIIQQRLEQNDPGSYTARLAKAGRKRIAQKLGEEGVELALAAATGDREEVLNEAADLIYHLIVLLREQDIALGDVADTLRARHDES